MAAAVSIERLPPAEPLAAFGGALLLGTGAGSDLLPAVPRDDEAWRAAAASARRDVRPLSAEVVRRLVERLRTWGAGPRAIENARRMGEPGTLAIVTGQQPGLFGGTLLSFHKAAGAVNLAARIDALDAGPVVPVFWLASEDHDGDEANRLWLLDRESHVRRLRIDGVVADGRSLEHLDVPEAASDALLGEVRGIVPDTERAGEILGHVARRPAESFTDWCGRCLVELMGDNGLVVLDPFALLPEAGPVFRRLLDRRDDIRDAMHQAALTLQRRGLPAPLALEAGAAPLFLREASTGPRYRVHLDSSHRMRPSGTSLDLTLEDLRHLLDEDPKLASGDAAGRVFVQNELLPILAYVGGPTELAYHVQVRAAHERLGLRYPVALPRPVATWADAKAGRAAEAFDVSLAELLRDPGRLEGKAAGLDDTLLRDALEAWVRHVGEGPQALAPYRASGGQGAEALRSATERLVQQAGKQAGRIEAAFARDRGVGADRRRRLEDLLHPRGRAQERSLSPLTFALRHGVEVFREGLAGLDPLHAGDQLVHVKGGGEPQ